jgi:hypothetical protein
MSLIHSPNIITSGLVLALDAANVRSYPGTGTSWFDLSGNGRTGTLNNSPTFSTSDGGNFSFDYTDDFITTVGMGNFAYTGGITVSVWNYNGGGAGSYRGVVNNGTVADRIGGFDLRYGRENFNGGTNNGTSLYFNVTNSASVTTGITINAPVAEWHCYTVTYDNTTSRGYRDGTLFTSTAHTAGGQLKTMADSTMIARSPGTSEFLDGKLAIVKIYNRALTAAEIAQNYNATKRRFGL